MRESSRPAESGQKHSRYLAVDRAQSFQESRAVSASLRHVWTPGLGGHSKRRAMESFGNAIAELFECGRCFVAAVSGDGAIGEQVRIGYALGGMPDAAIAHIARLASEDGILSITKSDASLARSVIGLENMPAGHSIVGRINAEDNEDLVFIAGWRATPLAQAEIVGLSRAARVIWTSAVRLTHQRRGHSDLQDLLGELVFPAFVVDENLHLHEVNQAGKKLLLTGRLLRSNGGLLAGANVSVTGGLKEAVCNALMSRSDQRWTSSTIVLSAGHQQFAFAWVGTIPTRQDARQVLVIVPRVDEAMGARRIATAFGLNCVEEKIIARILHGDGPRDIGADLGLTEATVRTYTKRIMLKLGINRQSELFLLYILTLSPFGAGRPERALSSALTCARLNSRLLNPQNN